MDVTILRVPHNTIKAVGTDRWESPPLLAEALPEKADNREFHVRSIIIIFIEGSN